jgi:hypothetical protein
MRSRRRQGGATWFRATVAVIVILGVLIIVQSRDQRAGVALPGAQPNKDHWHAALGVNICGTWQPPVPTFEGNGGVHSHGDGLMHIHPFDNAHAHNNASIGTFFAGASKLIAKTNDKVSATSISFAGKTYKNGDKCDKKEGKVRWVVKGKERTGSGNPSKYAPKNGDYITLAFVPADFPFAQIKEPNTKSALNNISDLGSSSTTAPGETPSTAPGETTTAPTTPTTAANTSTTAKK